MLKKKKSKKRSTGDRFHSAAEIQDQRANISFDLLVLSRAISSMQRGSPLAMGMRPKVLTEDEIEAVDAIWEALGIGCQEFERLSNNIATALPKHGGGASKMKLTDKFRLMDAVMDAKDAIDQTDTSEVDE